jgi:hypothetical protein
MKRPVPTPVFHFTDEIHLPAIIASGLLADTAVGDLLVREAGLPGIKLQRKQRAVPIGNRGCVGDYVPFYYAPQSPMMFVISRGQVPAYGTDLSRLVYLVSSIERLIECGYRPLYTSRNATLANSVFTEEVGDLDNHVDWAIMREQYWRDTPTDGDRKARRMAECLVHRNVGWAAIDQLGVFDQAAMQRVTAVLARADATTPVYERRGWYY